MTVDINTYIRLSDDYLNKYFDFDYKKYEHNTSLGCKMNYTDIYNNIKYSILFNIVEINIDADLNEIPFAIFNYNNEFKEKNIFVMICRYENDFKIECKKLYDCINFYNYDSVSGVYLLNSHSKFNAYLLINKNSSNPIYSNWFPSTTKIDNK